MLPDTDFVNGPKIINFFPPFVKYTSGGCSVAAWILVKGQQRGLMNVNIAVAVSIQVLA